MTSGSDPHVLDQPWRIWASVAVLGILLAGVLLGVLIIPVVQGRSDGIDAYTAICRALGILPGSPARQQVCRPHAADAGLAGGLDAGRAADSRRRQTGARARQGAGGLRRLPRRAGRLGVARLSASGRPVGRGDLQAAQRLQNRQPNASADDRLAKALDEAVLADVSRRITRRGKHPIRIRRRSLSPAIVRLVELGDPGRNIRPARRATGPARAADRDPDPCRAGKGILSAAVEALCLGRAAQRCLRTHAGHRSRLTQPEIDGLAAYYRAGFR